MIQEYVCHTCPVVVLKESIENCSLVAMQVLENNRDLGDKIILTLKMTRKCRLFMSSAEYSCKLFKPIFARRQTVWTQIRLLLEEQSDLGPHCLQK